MSGWCQLGKDCGLPASNPMKTTETIMRKRTIAASIAILSAVAFGSNATAEEKFQKLTGTQIRSKFAGMEMTDNVHGADFYERNGNLTFYSMGRMRVGKWRVEKDELCLDLGHDSSSCYEVWLSGKNVELRGEGTGLPFEGVLQKPINRN
jgi:hypothetical protein